MDILSKWGECATQIDFLLKKTGSVPLESSPSSAHQTTSTPEEVRKSSSPSGKHIKNNNNSSKVKKSKNAKNHSDPHHHKEHIFKQPDDECLTSQSCHSCETVQIHKGNGIAKDGVKECGNIHELSSSACCNNNRWAKTPQVDEDDCPSQSSINSNCNHVNHLPEPSSSSHLLKRHNKPHQEPSREDGCYYCETNPPTTPAHHVSDMINDPQIKRSKKDSRDKKLEEIKTDPAQNKNDHLPPAPTLDGLDDNGENGQPAFPSDRLEEDGKNDEDHDAYGRHNHKDYVEYHHHLQKLNKPSQVASSSSFSSSSVDTVNNHHIIHDSHHNDSSHKETEAAVVPLGNHNRSKDHSPKYSTSKKDGDQVMNIIRKEKEDLRSKTNELEGKIAFCRKQIELLTSQIRGNLIEITTIFGLNHNETISAAEEEHRLELNQRKACIESEHKLKESIEKLRVDIEEKSRLLEHEVG